MSKEIIIRYYDEGGAAWIPLNHLGYDALRSITDLGVDVGWNTIVTRSSTLLNYALRTGASVKRIGRMVPKDNDGSHIVMDDDGRIETPTEDRLAHVTDHIVVAPAADVYKYMILHASLAGLIISSAMIGQYDHTFRLSFTTPESYSLEDLIKGAKLEEHPITISNVTGESYNAIEASLDMQLSTIRSHLHAHGDNHNEDHDAISGINEHEEAEPSNGSDNDLSDSQAPGDHMAVITFNREDSSIHGYCNASYRDWDGEYKVIGTQLIDDSRNVLIEAKPGPNADPWNSGFWNLVFHDADKDTATRATVYRVLLRGKIESEYRLADDDPLLPSSLSAADYDNLSDFMKSKYSANGERTVESHVDYPIISRTYDSVDEIMNTRPVSESLGMLIRELLGYGDDHIVSVTADIGSVIAHNSTEISMISSPYDGSKKPRYSSDHRRRRTPIGYYPVYSDKLWTLRYDGPEWPIVYGRSHEELLDQARSVLGGFDQDNSNKDSKDGHDGNRAGD